MFGSQSSDASQRRRADATASDAIIPVLPQRTDPGMRHWLTPHQVILPQPEHRRRQLFIFLAGSFGTPTHQYLLLKEAVQSGYHVINLCYPNSWTVGALCRRCADANCHENIRLSILDGLSRSNLIQIDRTNSIENRLVQLLSYLHQQHPDGEWQTYLNEGQPRWETIAIAGHSQGGGHAAIIAKRYQVARCIMLGSPADFSPVLQAPAPWLSAPSATPIDRYYGFAHLQDKGIQRILRAWGELGLTSFGPPSNIDGMELPYAESHQLVTNIPPAKPGKHHGCVAIDGQTPKSPAGVPLFRTAWQYLLG